MTTSTDLIPLSVPEIRGNEWKYIKNCLDTGWVSSVGSYVNQFESDLAAYVGTQYAVATVNGTAALHIALLVAGVEPDDEVLVSALTFIAPANAIRYCGAWPVFIDAEPNYWQMDPELVINFLDNECYWSDGTLYNKNSGRRVKAIIPVHILGHPCDMDPILNVARKYDLTIIEDATESLGAKYKNRMVGTLGDIACFSFNGNKIITTGGGGMLVTDNQTWAERAQYLTTQAKDDPIEYVHNEVGYNYRLTNIQAAMGCAQLEKLDEFISVKRDIARRYTLKFTNLLGIRPMLEATWSYSVKWLYTILVETKVSNLNRQSLQNKLQVVDIQTRPLWLPLHQNKIYQNCQIYCTRNIATQIQQSALSLPCSVSLSIKQQERVVKAIYEILNA